MRRPNETLAIPNTVDDADTVVVNTAYMAAVIAESPPLPDAQDIGGVVASRRYMQRIVEAAAVERRQRLNK